MTDNAIADMLWEYIMQPAAPAKVGRKYHRYTWVIIPHPKKRLADAGIGQPIEICKRCFTVRECIGTVGFHLRIRSYIRPDGVRFTGQAPSCI